MRDQFVDSLLFYPVEDYESKRYLYLRGEYEPMRLIATENGSNLPVYTGAPYRSISCKLPKLSLDFFEYQRSDQWNSSILSIKIDTVLIPQ
jgi:hypothetical protein